MSLGGNVIVLFRVVPIFGVRRLDGECFLPLV